MDTKAPSALSQKRTRRCGGRVDWVDYARDRHRHGPVRAFGARGRGRSQPDRCQHWLVMFAKPLDARFFLIRPVHGGRDRREGAHLSRPKVGIFAISIYVGDDSVRVKAPVGCRQRAVGARSASYLGLDEPVRHVGFIDLLPIFFVVTKMTRSAPPLRSGP